MVNTYIRKATMGLTLAVIEFMKKENILADTRNIAN